MDEFLIRVLCWASLVLFCCAGCSQFPNQNYAAPEARGWGTRTSPSYYDGMTGSHGFPPQGNANNYGQAPMGPSTPRGFGPFAQ